MWHLWLFLSRGTRLKNMNIEYHYNVQVTKKIDNDFNIMSEKMKLEYGSNDQE